MCVRELQKDHPGGSSDFLQDEPILQIEQMRPENVKELVCRISSVAYLSFTCCHGMEKWQLLCVSFKRWQRERDLKAQVSEVSYAASLSLHLSICRRGLLPFWIWHIVDNTY